MQEYQESELRKVSEWFSSPYMTITQYIFFSSKKGKSTQDLGDKLWGLPLGFLSERLGVG